VGEPNRRPASSPVQTWAAEAARRADPGSGRCVIRSTPSGAVIATCADVVVKVHRRGSGGSELAGRLRIGADPGLAHVLLAPLSPTLLAVPRDVDPAGRVASMWPRVEVLDPRDSSVAPEDLPWAEAGALLSRLHRAPVPAGAPADGSTARLVRALNRLEGVMGNGAGVVRAAGKAVTADLAAARTEHPAGHWAATSALVHGDWHLGQLGRRPGADDWLLIDLDDLGIGCPATDLGRPAGFWAAGLLPDSAWRAFQDGYRAAGGPALPATGDPWPVLDLPARAEVVVAAARAALDAQVTGRLDDQGMALLDACHWMRTA